MDGKKILAQRWEEFDDGGDEGHGDDVDGDGGVGRQYDGAVVVRQEDQKVPDVGASEEGAEDVDVAPAAGVVVESGCYDGAAAVAYLAASRDPYPFLGPARVRDHVAPYHVLYPFRDALYPDRAYPSHALSPSPSSFYLSHPPHRPASHPSPTLLLSQNKSSPHPYPYPSTIH